MPWAVRIRPGPNIDRRAPGLCVVEGMTRRGGKGHYWPTCANRVCVLSLQMPRPPCRMDEIDRALRVGLLRIAKLVALVLVGEMSHNYSLRFDNHVGYTTGAFTWRSRLPPARLASNIAVSAVTRRPSRSSLMAGVETESEARDADAGRDFP